MSEDHIQQDSCLLEPQHGYEEEEAVPLSPAEILEALEISRKEEQAQEISLASGVSRPAIHGFYQAKAATRRNRSNAQIDQIVMHTPEGYEGGTLSVLQQGRAGFDWYLPPSGRLYKCNAFGKYVAWQAGYWPSNLRSIGIEQYDFAANMGNAPDAHYRRLAALVAWLTQLLDIPVRHAAWDQPGLVAHAQITPKSRTDPGKDFDWDKLIRFTNEARGKDNGGAGPPSDTVFRVISGSFDDRDNANRRASQVKARGFGSPWIYEHDGRWRVQVASFSDRKSAEEVAERLEAKDLASFVAVEGKA